MTADSGSLEELRDKLLTEHNIRIHPDEPLLVVPLMVNALLDDLAVQRKIGIEDIRSLCDRAEAAHKAALSDFSKQVSQTGAYIHEVVTQSLAEQGSKVPSPARARRNQGRDLIAFVLGFASCAALAALLSM